MSFCAGQMASDLGPIGVVVSEMGVCRVVLGLSDGDTWLSQVTSKANTVAQRDGILDRAMGQITEYLAGQRDTFDLPLDQRVGTAFQQEVWRGIQAIVYGQVRTYGQVAEMIGRPGASRAVGGALGRNPIPILVPCHRVVSADGSLGGFSAGQDRAKGRWLKQGLLEIEGHLAENRPYGVKLPGFVEPMR